VNPSELELDALREVANVGAGHAANALSKLVGGRKVAVEVSRAALIDRGVVPSLLGASEPSLAAVLEILGEVSGQLALVLPIGAAQSLCGLLLNAPCNKLSTLERDAFSETANILASACLNAVSQLTGFRLLPSVPRLVQETGGALATRLLGPENEAGGVALVLQTRFFSPPIAGQLFLVPNLASVRPLLNRLGV
jgi:chemotaxis protein CheC